MVERGFLSTGADLNRLAVTASAMRVIEAALNLPWGTYHRQLLLAID